MVDIARRITIRLTGIGFGNQRRRAGRLHNQLTKHLIELLPAQTLLQIANAQKRSFIDIGVSGFGRRFDNLSLASVLADSTPSHQLIARPAIAVHSFLGCIGKQILDPVVQTFRHRKNIRDFFIREQIRLTEITLCQSHMILAALSAGIPCFTETAPLTCTEFALTFIGEHCLGAYLSFSPANQIIYSHFIGRSIGQSGLYDCHTNSMNVVQRIEFQQRAKAIEHQLTVASGFYTDAATALKVNDFQHTVCDDHKVAGTESIRNVLAVIQSVFDHDQRIGTGRPDRLDGFNAEGNIFIRDTFGLVRVEIVVTMLGILQFNKRRIHVAQIPVQLQFTQFMKECSFLRIG